MADAVLNPSAETKTSITEIRDITHNAELVGKPEVRVERGEGETQIYWVSKEEWSPYIAGSLPSIHKWW